MVVLGLRRPGTGWIPPEAALIVFGGVLLMMCGIGLVGIGHPIGWAIAFFGFVAIMGGIWEKLT